MQKLIWRRKILKKKEYAENRYHNMSEEKKQRFKEYHKNYRKIKMSQYNEK